MRPGHIHFEVRSEFEEESMEFCDFRFYSVEKAEEPEVEAAQEGEAAQEDEALQADEDNNDDTSGGNEDSGNERRRRLDEDGNAGSPGEEDIGKADASGDDPEKSEVSVTNKETEGEKEEEEKEKKGIVTASPKGPNA